MFHVIQQHPLRRMLADVDTRARAIFMSSSAGHEDTGAILLTSPSALPADPS